MTALAAGPRHAASVRVIRHPWMSAWQRSAEQARRDRLVTAGTGVAGAIAGTAAALLADGTAVAVWIGLVTLCVTPGCALACWLSTAVRLTRAVTVIAASLTWTILVSAVLAWFQVTGVEAFLLATAGVGAVGSAAFLLAQLVRYLKRTRVAAQADVRGQNAGQGARGGRSDRGFAATCRLVLRPEVLLISSLLGIAAALLAVAVIHARGRAVGGYGLLPVLGVSFLASTALTIAALVLALRFVRTAWPAAVVALCLLLVELDGTPMMLTATPLSSWTYKHFGVVEYMVHGGALTDRLDIYQQWPGFFAAAASLVRLSGLGPMAYSNWAQLFFEALNGVVIFAIARRFSQGNRIVPYIAVLLFETANWEGQFYYSPQTTAFLLALLFQFFMLPLLEPARLRQWFARRQWFGAVPLFDIEKPGQADAAGTALRGVGLVALFGALIITHQLSPYVVFAGVVGLWVLGVLRRPVVLLTLVAMIVLYPLVHLSAIDHNQLLTGFSFSNATGKQSTGPGSPAQALAGIVAKAIALGFWGATGVCVLSRWRHLGDVAVPAILAAAPISFILVTNYDGEAIYRAFLFSSPWCALLIARRLADVVRLSVLPLAVAGAWALLAALGSAQAQDFGMYPMLQVPLGEVNASAYFLDHAPPNATLVLAAANFPSRLNGRYTRHDVMQTQNDPSLDESPELEGNGLMHTSPRVLARSVAYLANGTGYLVVAPSMDQYVDYYRVFAPGTLSALVPRLEESRYWQVWYKNNDTIIFRAWPGGRPATTPSSNVTAKSGAAAVLRDATSNPRSGRRNW
jgi:hypothetical protein